jgi:hypothetical protein
MSREAVSLKVEQRREVHDPLEADRIVREYAVQCGDPAWALLQSFTDLSFVVWNTETHRFNDVFNGRIFGNQGEVRWVREGLEWTIWFLQEVKDGGKACYRRERLHYLWGIYQTAEDRFVEDRIPGVPKYRELFSKVPQDQDRAFIQAFEYESKFAESLSPEELERELNQPRIWAHRFASVSCGRSKPESKPDGDEE